MGVPSLNYKELLRILRLEVGVCRDLRQPPVITYHLQTEENRHFLAALRERGFEVIESVAKDGADDQILIDRLAKVDPQEVSEVVMVSADSDFLNPLRKLKARGVKDIYLVASREARNDRGSLMLGLRYEEAFERGELHFFELARFKQELIYLQNTGNGNGHGKEHHPAEPEGTRFVVESPASSDPGVVNDALMALKDRFPDLKVRMQK